MEGTKPSKMLEEYCSKHVQWAIIEKIWKGWKDEVEVVDECAFEDGWSRGVSVYRKVLGTEE